MTVQNGDILKTTAVFTLGDGAAYRNVFYHEAQLAAPQADLSVVNDISSWATALCAIVDPQVADDVTVGLWTVDQIEWVTDQWEVTRSVGSFTPTFAGEKSTDPSPNQVSPYIVFKTDRPKSMGKKFLFPMTEDAYVGSYLTGTMLTVMTNAAAQILNNIVLAPLNELVPGIPRTGADVWLPFVVAIVTNVVGTQRRRRPGVGE